MEDDELFRRTMQELGVDPLEKGSRRRRRGKTQESQAFAAAVARAKGDAPPAPRPLVAVRRKRPHRRHPTLDGTLDLHGRTTAEALRALAYFVNEAHAAGSRTLLVITGKGHHSPGGVAVLKRQVEGWITRQGQHLIRSFAPAPRELGGRGALVLSLRRHD